MYITFISTYRISTSPQEKIFPDSAVKKEIATLKVVCENTEMGCNWKGLFKDYSDHLQNCQYITVECRNPECCQQVLLIEIEDHLKNKCPSRLVNCKDCGKKLVFRDLELHSDNCPNALKKCENCQEEMPAFKLSDHVMKECTWIKCVCSSEGADMLFEKTSEGYYKHLQEPGKLANHLQPLISELFEMKQSLNAMSNAYQLMNIKIATLEAKSDDLEKKNEKLHQENANLQETVKQLSRQLEDKLNKFDEAAISQVGEVIHTTDDKIAALEKWYGKLETEITTTKASVNKSSAQVEAFTSEVNKLKKEHLSL